MNTLRRVMAVLLFFGLVLAGCQQATPTPQVVKETVEVVKEVTKVVEVAGTPQVVKEVEVVTATPEPVGKPDKVVIWHPCGQGSVADWSYDPILQAVEKATNTDIEIVNMSGEGFVDRINAAAASGELPDIIGLFSDEDRALHETLARDGAIAAFEGAVAEAAPNVITEYEDNPMLEELKVDSKIYFQPIYWGRGMSPNMGLFHIRKDLLDKYGMEPPETFDQYFEFLEMCKAKGDGAGVVFEGIGGVGPAINSFAGAYGLPFRGWVKVDGGYGYWAVQPGMKDALLLFREMVARDLVDPAVWEMDEDTARAAYVSGKACSFIFNGGGHVGRIQNDMALVDESLREWLLPALDAGAGSRGYTSEPMFWGVSALGGMKHNNPVAAARVMNFLMSDEGHKLTIWGIEGRDYEVVNDEVAFLPQRTKDGFPTEAGDTGTHPLATCVVSWVPRVPYQVVQITFGKDAAWKEWFNEMKVNQTMYQVPAYGLLTGSPLWTEFRATGDEMVRRSFLQIVRAGSKEEAAALFDQFVQEWLAAGGADAQAEMSRVLSEMLK